MTDISALQASDAAQDQAILDLAAVARATNDLAEQLIGLVESMLLRLAAGQPTQADIDAIVAHGNARLAALTAVRDGLNATNAAEQAEIAKAAPMDPTL